MNAEDQEKTEERLVELEIRLAFQDDLVEELNKTISRQQKELALLQQEMRIIWQALKQWQAGASGERSSIRDDIPPHY